MCRKIINDYMKDLFEIKLIFLRSESYVAMFSICMDAIFFDMRCSFQFSPYICNR